MLTKEYVKIIIFSVTKIVLIFLIGLTNQSFNNTDYIDKPSIFVEPIMCTELVGRCTGSAYCTACSNCSRCGYCNSGGSCGVCGKSVKTYRPKKKKKTTSKYKSIPKKTAPSPASQSTHLTEVVYILKDKTSLRQLANSKATVLKRLAKNDKVQMVDGSTEKYWCKVIYKGKMGWVKKHLLEKKKLIIYP